MQVTSMNMGAGQNPNTWPHGLNVLVVDDDISCLKILSVFLQECKYKVTVSNQATKAFELLRKNMYGYDIVIAEVNMPEMDGLQLLRLVSLEMDIPFIMISENDDKETIMKCVQLGAKDYLVKPIRMKELKNIWQHVLRMKLFDYPQWTRMEPIIKETGIDDSQSDKELHALKKPRVRWTKSLDERFTHIVEKLGNDAVPKKIIKLLNEPHLTIAHISSHLQKYRNGLKKGGMKSTKPYASQQISRTLPPSSSPPLQVCSINNNGLITSINVRPIQQLCPYKRNPFVPDPSLNMLTQQNDGVQTYTNAVSGQVQNQENVAKVYTSYADLETTMAENAMHVESSIHDENERMEDNKMLHQQDLWTSEINITYNTSTGISEEEDNIEMMIEECMNLPPIDIMI